jgi:hypothetical protein
MAETGIFISSCSRRELARRRQGRSSGVPSVLWSTVVVLVLLAIALGALVLARGGI